MGLMIGRKTNRAVPKLPVTALRTFQIAVPLETHWRDAECAEIQCGHYLNGWAVHVEALTPDLVHAARTSGRRYREEHLGEAQTWLVFEAGQPCFKASEHRIRTGRPELYSQRDGDWRGNPTGWERNHARPGDWLDAFANHQDRLVTRIGRG